jgi:hypothetical protein
MIENDKRGMKILAAAGVLALGLGVWQITHNIRAPFRLRPLPQAEEASVDLRTQDTDKDGITDFDELYIYNSSPYLEDSDSDGKTDSEEVRDSTDPNCPEGKECAATENGEKNVGIIMPPTQTIGELSSPIIDEKGNIKTNLPPAEIRKLLIGAGMSEEDLKKLDDETLKELYQDALKQSGATN